MEQSSHDPFSHLSEQDRQTLAEATELAVAELQQAADPQERAEIVGLIGETLAKEGIFVTDVNSESSQRRGARTGRTREQVLLDRQMAPHKKKSVPLISRHQF